MLLDNLQIVLIRPRFPENTGMVARACANFGCPDLCLVQPERHDSGQEMRLATSAGKNVLANMKIYDTLDDAVATSHIVYGTTARTGGWRKTLRSPGQAAAEIAAALCRGLQISILMGSEDRGLENREISLCASLIHTQTFGASSLNLAQATLLVLYECSKAMQAMRRESPNRAASQAVSIKELAMLEAELKKSLALLECMHGKNPDYYFIQWHELLARAVLRRHEFDALMGFCRQLNNKLKSD